MRFLIVGASGFVGRHALAYVRSLGYAALGTQSRDGQPGLITFDLLRHRISHRIPPAFFENDEPVIGVICAAVTQIDRCAKEQETSYKVNVERTIQLIHDLTALGAKPIFLSSSFVYDGAVGYYGEDYPHSPVSAYGRHKSTVERYLQEHLPDVLVLRLDKIVGDDPSEHHLFSEWYHWVSEGRPITCIEDQVFSPTFVTDVAGAIVASCGEGLSGVYNVAGSEFFSRVELARQFVLALGRDADIVCKSQAALKFLDLRPLKSYLDSTKFVKATGMRFTSMREVFQVFRQHLGRVSDLTKLEAHSMRSLAK